MILLKSYLPTKVEVKKPVTFADSATFNESKIYGSNSTKRYITAPPASTTSTVGSSNQRDLPIGGIAGCMLSKALLYPYGTNPSVFEAKYKHAGKSITVTSETLGYAEFNSAGSVSYESIDVCFLPSGTYTLLTSAKFNATTQDTHNKCYVFALVMRTA